MTFPLGPLLRRAAITDKKVYFIEHSLLFKIPVAVAKER